MVVLQGNTPYSLYNTKLSHECILSCQPNFGRLCSFMHNQNWFFLDAEDRWLLKQRNNYTVLELLVLFGTYNR